MTQFLQAFAPLNALNLPLAFAAWPQDKMAVAAAVAMMAPMAYVSTTTPSAGSDFDLAVEKRALSSLVITSLPNRLVRSAIAALNLIVGLRCAARTDGVAKQVALDFFRVLGAFLVGGSLLTTAYYGQ